MGNKKDGSSVMEILVLFFATIVIAGFINKNW